MNPRFKILLSSLLAIFIVLGFALQANPPGPFWYQQFMPSIGNRTIYDITFIDSLTGYATANSTSDTNYILKTTNSGDAWQIITRQYLVLQRLKFLNVNTGYVCGAYLQKTTNGGINWNQVTAPAISPEDLAVINESNIWIISSDGLTGGVFRTTDSGASWQQQLFLGSQNPDHIYMFNARIGFVTRQSQYIRRTTNGGQTWTVVESGSGAFFTNMYFTDSLTGWMNAPGTSGSMWKSSNGGLNWINQVLPLGGNIIADGVNQFSNINADTIWAVGGIYNSPTGFRGMTLRTTNGGSNWLFQIPDTSINIWPYNFCRFVNKFNGWAYKFNSGIHTVIGGDTVFYTGVQQISNNVPKDFELKQNYPNPFNPRTLIPYSIKKSAYVRVIVYDILGREVQKLVDQKQRAGEYEVDFMGKFAASGMYFYSLFVDGKLIDTKRMVLVK